MKLKIENKKTGKHKFFTRRDVFIEFLKQQKNKENYLNWLKEHPDEGNIYDSI